MPPGGVSLRAVRNAAMARQRRRRSLKDDIDGESTHWDTLTRSLSISGCNLKRVFTEQPSLGSFFSGSWGVLDGVCVCVLTSLTHLHSSEVRTDSQCKSHSLFGRPWILPDIAKGSISSGHHSLDNIVRYHFLWLTFRVRLRFVFIFVESSFRSVFSYNRIS